MKKLTYLIKTILPGILSVSPTDDGSLFITYLKGKDYKDTIITLTDYEKACAHSQKINGLMDRVHGLS